MSTNTTPQWQREFPDMTDMPAIPEGWVDQSWHNDASPKFSRVIDGREYLLWVDYPKHEQSEVGFLSVNHTGEFRRFCVQRIVPDSTEADAFAYFSHIGALDVCLTAVKAGA